MRPHPYTIYYCPIPHFWIKNWRRITTWMKCSVTSGLQYLCLLNKEPVSWRSAGLWRAYQSIIRLPPFCVGSLFEKHCCAIHHGNGKAVNMLKLWANTYTIYHCLCILPILSDSPEIAAGAICLAESTAQLQVTSWKACLETSYTATLERCMQWNIRLLLTSLAMTLRNRAWALSRI